MHLLLGSGLLPRIFRSPEIVARKLVAVKVILLQKPPPYHPLNFARESKGKFCTFEEINWKAVEGYSAK